MPTKEPIHGSEKRAVAVAQLKPTTTLDFQSAAQKKAKMSRARPIQAVHHQLMGA